MYIIVVLYIIIVNNTKFHPRLTKSAGLNE